MCISVTSAAPPAPCRWKPGLRTTRNRTNTGPIRPRSPDRRLTAAVGRRGRMGALGGGACVWLPNLVSTGTGPVGTMRMRKLQSPEPIIPFQIPAAQEDHDGRSTQGLLGGGHGGVQRSRGGGLFDGRRLELEEVYRFENGPVAAAGRMYWDLLGQWAHVQRGLQAAAAKYGGRIVSVGRRYLGRRFRPAGPRRRTAGQSLPLPRQPHQRHDGQGVRASSAARRSSPRPACSSCSSTRCTNCWP